MQGEICGQSSPSLSTSSNAKKDSLRMWGVVLLWLGCSVALGHSHAEAVPGPSALSLTKGKALYTKKGCVNCHSTDGSKALGPTMRGAYGKMVKLTNGKTVRRDDAYFAMQIRTPQKVHVAGFPPVMPPYKNLSALELQLLIAYIKSLSVTQAKTSPKKSALHPASKQAEPSQAKSSAAKSNQAQGNASRSWFEHLAAGKTRMPFTAKAFLEASQTLAIGRYYYVANCSFCHGREGKGNGPGGRGASMGIKNFAKGEFLYGKAPQAIVNIITNGSPRTKLMPAFGHLPKKVRYALAAYLLSLSKPTPQKKP